MNEPKIGFAALVKIESNVQATEVLREIRNCRICREAPKGRLDEVVKAWREGLSRSPAVFPLPHPSWRNNVWLKRNPWFEAELLPVLRPIVAELV